MYQSFECVIGWCLWVPCEKAWCLWIQAWIPDWDYDDVFGHYNDVVGPWIADRGYGAELSYYFSALALDKLGSQDAAGGEVDSINQHVEL